MATFHGVKGRVQAQETVFNVHSWKINVQREFAESSVLDTGTTTKYKTKAGGYVSWNGSFEGFLDDTTVFTIADDWENDPGTATFTDGHSNTYVGTIFLTNLEVENSADDMGKFICSFEGSGALTIAQA